MNTQNTTSKQFASLGLVDSDPHGCKCQCCGAHCPKRLVALDQLDAAGNRTGNVVFFGVVCAARALRVRGTESELVVRFKADREQHNRVQAAAAAWLDRLGCDTGRLRRFAAARAAAGAQAPAFGVSWSELAA